MNQTPEQAAYAAECARIKALIPHLYCGDRETVDLGDGYSARIKIEQDSDCGTPWDNCDGHGPVSDWTSRDKAPGERVLCADRGIKRFYDWAAAIKEAKRDGWDAPPYGEGTPGERAVRAAEADFQYLRAWCNNDWCYVGVIVTLYRDISRTSKECVGRDALWRVESSGDYPLEQAAEMIAGLMSADRDEQSEAAHWAARDVITEGARP